MGVDLFTRQIREARSFVANPEPYVVVQTMLGPVFRTYRLLDMDLSDGTGTIKCFPSTLIILSSSLHELQDTN